MELDQTPHEQKQNRTHHPRHSVMDKCKEEFEYYLSSTSLKTLLLLGLLLLQIMIMIALSVPVNRTTTTIATATTTATNQSVKVFKCCKSNETFNNFECESTNASHEFKVPKNVTKNGIYGEYEKKELELVDDMDCTNGYYTLNPAIDETGAFRVSETGWLIGENVDDVRPGQFCIEKINSTISALVCSINRNDDEIADFYVIGMVISILFLICTFLVYMFLDKFRNSHGKSLMCHIATMCMSYVGTLVISCYKPQGPADALCTVLAYVTQFSYLASFYWLNVMCFDLWWTFSGRRSKVKNPNQQQSKNFKIYSIYAWGCSLLISAITCYMQFNPFTASSDVHNPKFGQGNCWFQNGDRHSANLYFYGPITTLILCNLIMFIHTMIIIVRQLMKIKDIRKEYQKDWNNKNDTLRFILYLKLFFVTGVSWLPEMLAWYFEEETKDKNFIWYFSNVINAFRGLLIFFIYVCKKDVLILLNQKLCPKYVLYKTSTKSTVNTRNNV